MTVPEDESQSVSLPGAHSESVQLKQGILLVIMKGLIDNLKCRTMDYCRLELEAAHGKASRHMSRETL
jgi:hypothetical protein